LPQRNRQIAEALSLGHSTSAVAKRFKVSPGRISQLRNELQQSWLEFQGETSAKEANLQAAC
jgi:DNA-binding NarL/FixJ family response regulator